jgi:hypothetical protein
MFGTELDNDKTIYSEMCALIPISILDNTLLRFILPAFVRPPKPRKTNPGRGEPIAGRVSRAARWDGLRRQPSGSERFGFPLWIDSKTTLSSRGESAFMAEGDF